MPWHPCGSCLPGVDDLDAAIEKVVDVARGKHSPARTHDGGDHKRSFIKTQRVANGFTFGQFEFNATEGFDATADRINQVPTDAGASKKRRTQYFTCLVFYRTAVPGCLHTQTRFELLVDILNSHGHHVGLLVTVM
ncbi:hypothetical protein QCE83_09225 [Caballeronia sp. LZ034LL]|nr:hypothetical protein [Caballeronia sp. LZ034LL]MDR5834383.1 hypothetical protein [Caballeronia sp. LZ034LL]